MKLNQQLLRSALSATLFFFSNSALAEPVPIDEVKLVGMPLTSSTLDSVRSHLWDIGGFLQARSTVRQRNVDKFFTWSNLNDSYYLKFKYNNAGDVVSAYRLFRHESIAFENRRTPIQTREVALKLINEIGQPTQIVKRTAPGSHSYNAYIWQGEQIKVVIDRQGSEIYGNIFIEYTVNKDPFFVAEKEEGA